MTGAASGLPSRREAMVGAGVFLLAGCLPLGDDPPVPAPDPELRVRTRIANEIGALTAAYAAVVDRFPSAATELAALATEHDLHVAALRGPGSPATPATRSASPSASPPQFVVSDTLTEARAALSDLERTAADRRARQAQRASPRLARLLASMSACETAHAALLDRAPVVAP